VIARYILVGLLTGLVMSLPLWAWIIWKERAASLERRRVKVRGIRASILKSFEEDIRARGKATPSEYRDARAYIESVIDKKWPIP
jgi:hypothetical protein